MRKSIPYGTILALTAKSAKLLKTFKALKLALSLTSMVVFGVCESWVLGAALAASLLFLLFLHEAGHLLALKRHGFGLKLPFFVPFFGAIIFSPGFEDRDTEACVGLAGPVLGTLAALLFAVPYGFDHNRFWLSASYIGIILNFFNMLPVSPLDGGRVTQAAEPRLKYVGYAAVLGLTVWVGEPGMLLLWMLILQDFNLSLRQAFFWCRIIWVVMMALTMLPVGHNHLGNFLDCMAGIVVVLMYWGTVLWREHNIVKELDQFNDSMECKRAFAKKFCHDHDKERAKPDDRPALDTRSRWLWFTLWLGLGAIQFWILCAELRLIK